MTISFIVLSALLFLMSTLPSTKITHWSVRIFDYIRIQMFILLFILLVISLYTLDNSNSLILIGQTLIVISLLFQTFVIAPYLPYRKLFNKRVPLENDIRLLSINVLQKNNEYQRLIDMVNDVKPNILLTMETNKEWEEQLQSLESDYTTVQKIPLENRYGMHFYTNLEVKDIKEHYFLDDGRPAIEALMLDKEGNPFVFWGFHPPPPSPTEKPSSRQLDAELMKLAKHVKNDDYPIIVSGDFNCVCWSRSSKLFAKISNLNDARIGNGIHGSFPVRPKIFRFPIDLLFSSDEIQIGAINILCDIGSDHLPISSRFSVIPKKTQPSKPLDPELKEEIEEIIEDGEKAVIEEEGHG